MNIAPKLAQKTKIGTCPHGLPQGACPICSGMGGGGGGGSTASKTQRPAGEMSWDQCYAVWQQMLKAKEIAQQKRNDALLAQMQPSISFGERLANLSIKITNLADKLIEVSQNVKSLPKIISTPILLATKFLVGVLNVLGNVSIFVQKAANFIQQRLTDISDKLNAIFGELKNSIEKKISDKLKNFKKKFRSIFGINEPEKVDDENKQIEEEKQILESVNKNTHIPSRETPLYKTLSNLRQRLFEKKE